MKKATAAQQRLFDKAVLIAATRLLFDAMREHFSCPQLAEIVTIHNGQGLTAADRDAAGEYDVYAAGGLVGRHSARLSDKPFVVVGRKGSAGKPTYAPLGGWVIDTAYYVQPNDDAQLDCKFLFYALSSLDFADDIISTAIPGINRTSIYRYAIPLPPKNVQEACVRFLDVAAARPSGEFPFLHRFLSSGGLWRGSRNWPPRSKKREGCGSRQWRRQRSWLQAGQPRCLKVLKKPTILRSVL